MISKRKHLLAITGCAFAFSSAAQGLVINEMRTDQPGFPDDEEFIELRGEPGTSLDDVWFLYVGDHSGDGATKGSGVIERAFDLTGYTIPDDGHFLMIGSSFDGDSFGIGLDQADYVNGIFGNALENSDNVTAILVRGFTEGEIIAFEDQEGDAAVDIDDNDDGVPNETLPWSETIDAIGLIETPSSGEFYYGEALGFEDIGPQGEFVPSHIFRGGDDQEWNMGEYVLFEEDDDGNVIGINPEAVDTPGTLNPDSPAPTFPPFISGIDTVFAAPDSTVQITGENLDTVTTVAIGETEVTFTATADTLTFDVPAGTPSGVVSVTNPDGSDSTAGSVVVIDPASLFFSETFPTDLGEFITFSVASNADWSHETFNDASYVSMNGFGADEASDDWLVSPAVDLSTVNNPFLMIGHERDFSGPPLEVLISTDYDGSSLPTTATWTALDIPTAGDDAFALVDSGEYDLSAYAGETVYLAFHYTSDGTEGGDGATDRIHYVAFGGESATGTVEDPNLGTLVYITPDWAQSELLGWVYTAEFPWVYSASQGWMQHIIRNPGVAMWFYGMNNSFVYVDESAQGWFFYWEQDDWAVDNFLNPQL